MPEQLQHIRRLRSASVSPTKLPECLPQTKDHQITKSATTWLLIADRIGYT